MNAGSMDATPLEIVVEFLNTLNQRSFSRHGVPHVGGDALTSPDALADWLGEHALVAPGTRLGAEDLDAALALRSALRTAVSARERSAGAEADATFARFPLRLSLDSAGSLGLIPAVGGSHAALGRLVATVAHAVADGRWRRVRLCAAADCRWAFHDKSRSGAGRWCSMATCGNRHKTRTYRERRHHGTES